MQPTTASVTIRNNGVVLLFLLGLCAGFSSEIRCPRGAQSFSPTAAFEARVHRGASSSLSSASDDENDTGSSLSNYKDSDGASKGIVGSLTGIVNKVSAASGQRDQPQSSLEAKSAPQTPEELLERIEKDYTERNYLWTGDLDLDCFFKECVFTDPTISFVGTDKFTENTQNLVPIVEAFAEDYRSDLLSISLGSGQTPNNQNVLEGVDDDGFFVESRWNMVGSLTANPLFFWKPKIDVIGRTKFWFRRDDSSSDGGYKVYFYDESWEIAAWKALLQIITPAGTFPSTSAN